MNKGNGSGLVNKGGKRKYRNPDAQENVIKYIVRHDRPDNDLVTWGGIGIVESSDIPSVVDQFLFVQHRYTRKGDFGRYVDHEVFSISRNDEQHIRDSHTDLDKLARKMAMDFYEKDHCQVVYGVHTPDEEEKCLHIHFGINTVRFDNTRKRRENKRQTKERSERFIQIMNDEIAANME